MQDEFPSPPPGSTYYVYRIARLDGRDYRQEMLGKQPVKLGPVQIAAAVANEAISKARLLEATGSQESRF